MSDERITPEMIEAADHASLDPKGCYVPGVGNCGGTHNRCYWRDVLAAVYPLIEQDVTRRLAEQAGTNPWEHPRKRRNPVPPSLAACWAEGAAAGVAAERARILALLDEPRAYRLALAEYAARREQGHDRFEAMRLAVAAVRALVGGDDCARSLPRDTPTPEDTHEWRERDS